MTPTAKTQDACMTAAPLPVSAGPDSSLTGTYLNQFNEMVKLIEQLPNTPELIDDILNWHPTSYQDYFNASAMPGRVSAADVYASLNRCVRQNFEGVVDDLDRKALGAVAVASLSVSNSMQFCGARPVYSGSRRLHGLGLQQRRLHGDKAGVAQPRRLS